MDETREWFESWSKLEYARMGARATHDVTISAGPLLTPWAGEGVEASGDPFPHSMDPQLRALGLDTSLVRGVPSLKNAHVLCRKGDKLSSEKCRVLKLLAIQMAVSQDDTGDVECWDVGCLADTFCRSSRSPSARTGPRALGLSRAASSRRVRRTRT